MNMNSREICFYCNQNVNEVCSICKLIGVCKQHQKFHQSSSGTCYPVKVELREGIGRCITTLRDVLPGELLLEDDAIVFGPKSNFIEPVCIECLKSCQNSFCPKCQLPKCHECHINSIAIYHNDSECQQLKQYIGQRVWSSEETEWIFKCLTPLRLFKAQAQNDQVKERLDYLMDHLTDLDPDEKIETQMITDRIIKILQVDDFDTDTVTNIERCIGLLKTNALDGKDGRGRILLPTFSFLSHSCVNNSKHVLHTNGNKIRLYSQRSICSGEEVTITYINLLRGSNDRQPQLQYQWNFKCQCPRCLDPTDLGTYIGALKCPHCLTGNLLFRLEEVWKCENCDGKIENQDAENLIFTLHQMFKEIVPNEEKIPEIENFLHLTENILHENHFIRIIAMRILTQLYPDSFHSRKKQFCEKLLEIFNKLDDGLSQSRGVTLVNLAKSKMDSKDESNENIINDLEEAIGCLKEENPGTNSGFALSKALKLLQLLKQS